MYTLIKSIKKLANVTILTLISISIFALIGQQLFMGQFTLVGNHDQKTKLIFNSITIPADTLNMCIIKFKFFVVSSISSSIVKLLQQDTFSASKQRNSLNSVKVCPHSLIGHQSVVHEATLQECIICGCGTSHRRTLLLERVQLVLVKLSSKLVNIR